VSVEQVRALVVLSEPPLAEGRAAGRMALATARGLMEHGVRVKLLAARQSFAMPGQPPDDVGVEVVDVPPEPPGWGSRLRRLRRPVGEVARSGFADRVREAAREADVLHLEEIGTAWCDERLKTPSLLHLHYLIRWDRSLGVPWRRSFRHTVEFELAERVAIRRHDRFVAASPRIAAELRRRKPSAEVEIVPPCLDPRDYPVAPLDGPPVAGLVGTAAWPPTRNAIERLLEDLWPEVRRRLPEARLVIAGRGTEALSGRAGEGVDVLGEVPSGVEFLRGLSVLLYPLDRGSGVKVKTLESIAVGLPVVTTPLGAEGIDGGDGVVVAEATDDLAAAAVAILADPGERRQRGAAGREAFERRYSPVPATEPLAHLYRRMLA
jgi:glycosyltransferase involved in cell wall biosynthesis